MKRTFKCSDCGVDFEIEATHFIPGISGEVVTSDGVVHTYVDPTEDHICSACAWIRALELFNGIKEKEEKDDVLE